MGEVAAALLEQGMLREGDPEGGGPGRPRQPLEIDPTRRRVVGLALEPGRASACQLNLQGRRVGELKEREVDGADQLVAAACELVREMIGPQALAVGVSSTGLVDPRTHSILTSSATQRHSPTRIESIYAAIGDRPVLLENDMHAKAAYWLLTQDAEPTEDVLMVEFRDGAGGAALLVNGRPNRGCVIGGNELGHTRFPVETDLCFCGQQGCLERICSSAFLRRIGPDPKADLYDRLAYFDPSDPVLGQVTTYLAMGIANAINFVRPNRVVLTGKVTSFLPFCNHLMNRVRALLLAPLADLVRIEQWERPRVAMAEAAGWLALAAIYRSGWVPADVNGTGSATSIDPKVRRRARKVADLGALQTARPVAQ